MLAARSETAADAVEWYTACQAAGVDPQAATQEISELPSYSPAAIDRQRDLLQAALRDQIRLDHLEHELSDLSGQLSDTYEELSLIYQISGGMRVNRRPVDFFQQTCADAIDVMGVAGMGVALPAGAKLGQAPVVFGKPDWDPAVVQRLSAELLAWMRIHKKSLISNDLSKELRFRWLAPHAKRLLAAPLQRGQDVLGCLFAVDKAQGDFDSVDSKLLNSIANESAIFLENAVLFEDVHGLMMGLLHSLTSAVDAKDAYTCGHSERVAVLSRAIARSAGLDEQLVERVYMAGLLHDVGKIGVPESVLQKPGRLTAEEFEQMKKHPTIGARILQDVRQIEDIIPGVLHHHERYDGKGYPHGLAGKEIPIMGRIICMADCFDAMTSTRNLPQSATAGGDAGRPSAAAAGPSSILKLPRRFSASTMRRCTTSSGRRRSILQKWSPPRRRLRPRRPEHGDDLRRVQRAGRAVGGHRHRRRRGARRAARRAGFARPPAGHQGRRARPGTGRDLRRRGAGMVALDPAKM